MPVLQCTCGHTTNTVACRWIDGGKPLKIAAECYARVVNNEWSKGCAYDSRPNHRRAEVDQLIATNGGRKSVEPG